MRTPTTADAARATRATPEDEAITAALLDALCAPQLYDITLRAGRLFIKPRAHMHPRQAALEDLN